MALMKFKRSAVPAKVPSIADLALGELAINTYDGKLFIKKDDGTQSVVEIGAGGGGGSGTVTSVAASGGTTGLTFTGSPITTSGTLTLGGTLAVANGGTGATTASTARANLSAAVLGDNGDITSLTGITGGISSPDFVQFDTAAVVTSAAGRLYYNDGEGGLSYGLKGGNVIQEVGQSQQVLIYNGTGATLTKGQVVYSNGAQGQRPTVALALATSDATSARTLGIVAESIANGAEGWVTTLGIIENINTSAFTAGAQLYLSGTTAGALTATKTVAPIHMVYVARCIKSHATSGRLFVTVQNGYELDELHDVSAVSPANNDGIFYNTTTSLWEKKSIVTALGYTPYNATNPAGYTTNTGTVTGVTGTAPIVSSGGAAPAISITAATTGAAGSMSAADKTKLDGIAANANNYVLPKATATTLGGVEVFDATVQTVAANAVTTTASRTYGVQLNSVDQMVINVPWVNSGGTVTGVTGTAPIVSSGGTAPAISISAATTSAAGSMSAADKTKLDGIATGATANTGTVTSVGGTGTVSGLTLTGTVTTTGNLTLGGTLAVTASNFASQTANTFLSAPNGAAGVPTFRAIVAADVPTLNQNTTGSAGSAANITGGNQTGSYEVTSGQSTRFGSANQTDGNDGKIGAGLFASGLNIVGTQTSAGTGRQVRIWGTVIDSGGIEYVRNTGSWGISVTGTAANVTGTVAIANGGTGATSAAAALTSLGAYPASNPNGYTSNTGTVTSVSGTGTVSGLTLSGTVTSSGNLTLGGTLTLTSGQVTTALGYTPYNSTNPSGYISANQTITLSGDVTGSGTTAITTTLANSGVTAGTYNSVTVNAKGLVTAGTAKQIPNVQSVTSSATVTPHADANDLVSINAQAVGLTLAAPTGTSTDGEKIIIRIKDNGTTQTIAWNAVYVAGGAALPTATVAGKWHHVGFIYNGNTTTWLCVAASVQT